MEADIKRVSNIGGYFGASIREELSEYGGLHLGRLHLRFFGIFSGKKEINVHFSGMRPKISKSREVCSA